MKFTWIYSSVQSFELIGRNWIMIQTNSMHAYASLFGLPSPCLNLALYATYTFRSTSLALYLTPYTLYIADIVLNNIMILGSCASSERTRSVFIGHSKRTHTNDLSFNFLTIFSSFTSLEHWIPFYYTFEIKRLIHFVQDRGNWRISWFVNIFKFFVSKKNNLVSFFAFSISLRVYSACSFFIGKDILVLELKTYDKSNLITEGNISFKYSKIFPRTKKVEYFWIWPPS